MCNAIVWVAGAGIHPLTLQTVMQSDNTIGMFRPKGVPRSPARDTRGPAIQRALPLPLRASPLESGKIARLEMEMVEILI